MNIYQRIAEVQKVCKYVKKDAEVGTGGNKYKAVTHDKVMELVRQPMIDNGILTFTSQQLKGEHYDGQTRSGTAKIRFEAVYDVSFVNIEDPEDRFMVSVEAHGEDSNDKAPGKAISYATKTAFLKTFMIATGENDEARMEEGIPAGQKPSAAPIDQQKELIRIRAALGGCKTAAHVQELAVIEKVIVIQLPTKDQKALSQEFEGKKAEFEAAEAQ